jgi:hypothetical protein
MPSATHDREQMLADHTRVLAIERVWWTLSTGLNGVETLDGPPLQRFEDEAELLDRMHPPGQFDALWPDAGGPPADSEEVEAWRKADLQAAQMLIALSGASEFCARAAQRLLERAGAVPKPQKDDEDDADA